MSTKEDWVVFFLSSVGDTWISVSDFFLLRISKPGLIYLSLTKE